MAMTDTKADPKAQFEAKRKELEAKLKDKLVELRSMYRTGQASLAKALMLEDDDVESIYAVGLKLLTQNKPRDAAQVLSNLCMIEPYDARYWRSLGYALIKMDSAQLAMLSFDMALANNEHDLPTLVYRGEQFILLGKKAEARKDLELALQVGKPQDKDDKAFVQRAKSLLPYAQTTH